MYDLTITGGTVVDGTGADRYRADIGIHNGRIVEVRRREGDDPGLRDAQAANTIAPATASGPQAQSRRIR